MSKDRMEFISGNAAAAEAVRLARVQVVPAYPITPATTVPEKIADFIADGSLHAKFIPVESEHSAMAACIGASISGARTFTATSSQGLELMNEMLPWASGDRLPIGMVNVNRALAAGWALWADHNDSMSVKDTGWMQLYVKDAQDVLDTILIGYKLAEWVNIPFMVVYEGFIVSHAYERVMIPDQSLVDEFLPPYKPKFKLDPDNPCAFGGMVLQTPYAEMQRLFHEDMQTVPKVAQNFADEFERITGRKREMVIETYNIQKAKTIIVGMGTMVSTIRKIAENDPEIGLIRIKMFRPFPIRALTRAIIGNSFAVKKIIVIDRNLSRGQGGHTWQELRAGMYSFRDVYKGPIFGYTTGLNGEDITPGVIHGIIDDAKTKSDDNQPILWRR